MAMYHFSISNVSRANGSSSCASLAYITGQTVTDERTGRTYDYARKERVLTTGTVLPESAPAEYADPKKLFNAIEQNEAAANARTAKKIELALPHELTLDRQIELVESFIRTNLTSRGYCATYAIHDQSNGNKNYHVHILVANRPIDKNGKWSRKRKTVFKLDENGERIPAYEYERGEDGEKILKLDENGQPIQRRDGKGTLQWERENIEQNPLDSKSFLKAMRKSWADEINRFPEIMLPVDHRSHAARRLDIVPTIHEGYAAREIERRGGVSERCQLNREIRAANSELTDVQFEKYCLEDDIADMRDRIDAARGAEAGGTGGKIAGKIAGAVKSAVEKSAGAILGEADGRGAAGVFADAATDVGQSMSRGDIVGAMTTPAKIGLGIFRNVESDDVQRDKMLEDVLPAAAGKAKDKKKEKAKKDPGRSRSRGR